MNRRADPTPGGLDPRLNTVVVMVLASTVLVASLVFGWLTYRELHGIIMEGFDRKLSALSATTAAFIDGEDHARILQRGEEDALYRRYAVPMRRIMARQGLTYLYTYVLRPDHTIAYVLDASEGEEHSGIGEHDELPADDAGAAEAILRSGKIHLSAIQAWEQWGILKSAYAPIRDPAAGYSAIAGADIDISIITTKTGSALARVGAVGLAVLLVGCLVTLSLSRRLAAPLAEVKEGALRVAAGEVGHRLPHEPLEELDQLAGCFNEMSLALQSALQLLRDESHAIVAIRRRQALGLALESHGTPAAPGTVSLPGGARLRAADPTADPLQPVRARREAEAVFGRVIASGGGEDEARRWLAPYLAPTDPDTPEGTAQ